MILRQGTRRNNRLVAAADLPGGEAVAFETIDVEAPALEKPKGISACWGLVIKLLADKHEILDDLVGNPKLLASCLSDAGDATLFKRLKQKHADLEDVMSKVLANYLLVVRGFNVDGTVEIKQFAAIPNYYRLMNHSSTGENIKVCVPRDQRVFYFTTKAIKKGEPLLIDYGDDYAALL